MNEALFFFHTICLLGFLALSLRFGQIALSIFVALSSVLANLFVVKQIDLFGLHVTCSDVFAVGGILGLNLLQEFFGRPAAQKAIQASILGLVFWVAMSVIHLHYFPNIFDRTQSSYEIILGNAPRIIGASMAVYYLVQRVDVIFFAFLQRKMSHLGARLTISLLVSQAMDTVLFSFFGLYGLVSSIFDIIIVSFLVKCLLIACSSWVAAWMGRFVRRDIA